MKKILIELSDALYEVIKRCKKGAMGPWIEQQLREVPAVQQTAREMGVEIPDRGLDRRGSWSRTKDKETDDATGTGGDE